MPLQSLVEVHSPAGVRRVLEPELLREESLFPELALPLGYIFDGKE